MVECTTAMSLVRAGDMVSKRSGVDAPGRLRVTLFEHGIYNPSALVCSA
jgi:hypothetical protein